MSSYKEDMTKLKVIIKHVTPNGVLVAYESDEFWIPRSTLSTIDDRKLDSTKVGTDMELRIADWLLREKRIL